MSFPSQNTQNKIRVAYCAAQTFQLLSSGSIAIELSGGEGSGEKDYRDRKRRMGRKIQEWEREGE